MAPVDRNSNSSLALQRRRNPRRPQDFRSGVSTAWNTLATVRTVIARYVLVISRYKDDIVVITLDRGRAEVECNNNNII